MLTFTFDDIVLRLLDIDCTIARYTETLEQIDIAKKYINTEVDYFNHPIFNELPNKLARQYLDLILFVQTQGKEIKTPDEFLHGLSDGALRFRNNEIVQVKNKPLPKVFYKDRNFTNDDLV